MGEARRLRASNAADGGPRLRLVPPYLGFILALMSGCGKTAIPGPAAAVAETYPIVGKVLEVDPVEGTVAIAHEAIPGYMPAMKMALAYKDEQALNELMPGDEVKGALRVGDASSEWADLVVTRPAVAGEGVGGVAPSRTLEVGAPVPDFEVTTQAGEPLRLSALRGKAVVVTFVYTRCPLPDYCPRVDRKFAELAAMIRSRPGGGGAVRLLSISFDPEHDTPAVLAAHARSAGAAPPLWTYAVASHAELSRVGPGLGLAYGPSGAEIAHNLSTAVVGPDGRLAWLASGKAGMSWSPGQVMAALKGATGR